MLTAVVEPSRPVIEDDFRMRAVDRRSIKVEEV